MTKLPRPIPPSQGRLDVVTARQRDKLVEAAQNAIEFTVYGRGRFPWDMLRYDHCWPATEAESHKLDLLSLPPDAMSERTITLRGLRPPTVDRWRSFGWEVIEVPS